jgi:hypothetical protein
VAVKPDLGVGGDLVDQCLHPRLRTGQHQRPGGVDHVDALGARVHHDPGLPGQRGRFQPVREHQEADRLHAQLAGRPEVLDRYVRLRAVRRDPGH